jgi:hypothetical protein
MKLRKKYEVTKKVLSYEKGTKLRKRYERVTKRLRNKLQSYEKDTKLRKDLKGWRPLGRPRPIFSMVTGTSPGYLPLLFSYNASLYVITNYPDRYVTIS